MSRPVAVFSSDKDAELSMVQAALQGAGVHAVILPSVPGRASQTVMVDDYVVKKALGIITKLKVDPNSVIGEIETAPKTDDGKKERGLLSCLKRMISEDRP